VAATKCPAATWLELIRNLESRQNFERAVAEYERLAAAYAAQKESLLALLSAGICLRKLNRPADTLRNYKAPQASTIPHLDWEPPKGPKRQPQAQVSER
jgi:hypothetical protein